MPLSGRIIPFMFMRDVAIQYGLEEAVMLGFLNRYKDADNIYSKSIKEISVYLGFWTDRQIRRIMKSLETQGAITCIGKAGKFDNTKVYKVNV